MKVLNIKFRKTKKVYPFLINEFQNFQKGGHVIVDTIRGEQIGIVLGVANKLGMELEENDEVKINKYSSANIKVLKQEKKDLYIRNYIAHFNYIPHAEISLLEVLENLRKLLSYDRKLKNAVM